MTLPTFIIFGTRKAGTTSLYKYLDEHPDVFMSALKGTRFFSYDPARPELGSKLPVKTLAEYESHFAGGAQNQIKAIGEVTPSYITGGRTAERIYQTLPAVKLIASLRNPVDRVYSQYQMDMRLRPSEEREELSLDNVNNWIPAGRYAQLLEPYYELFPADQIRLFVFEDWIKTPEPMLAELFEFIGVDPKFKPDLSQTFNKGGVPKNELVGGLLKHRPIHRKLKNFIPRALRAKISALRNMNMEKAPPLSLDIRAYLEEVYADDISALQNLTGLNLASWVSKT